MNYDNEYFIKAILSNSVLLDNIISTWNVFLPNSFAYGHLSTDQQEEITRKINAFYFGNETNPTRQLDQNSLVDVRKRQLFVSLMSLF